MAKHNTGLSGKFEWVVLHFQKIVLKRLDFSRRKGYKYNVLISKPNFGTAIAAAARLNRQPQKPDFSTAIAAAARLNRQPKRSALERSSIR